MLELITRIRTGFARAGGLQFITAVVAIGWGIGRLNDLVDERSHEIDTLTDRIETQQEALAANQLTLDNFHNDLAAAGRDDQDEPDADAPASPW